MPEISMCYHENLCGLNYTKVDDSSPGMTYQSDYHYECPEESVFLTKYLTGSLGDQIANLEFDEYLE
jgi:hypothetical protein